MSIEWYELDGDMGPGALPSGTATEGWMTGIESRLSGLEALPVPPDSITDLDGVSGTPATEGQIYQMVSGVLTPVDIPTKTVPFSVSFPIGTGTGTVTIGNVPAHGGVYFNHAATITGYVLDADNTISMQVYRATAASPATYSLISGSETPSRTGAGTTTDTNLTTWTTAISAGDRIRVTITGSPVAWAATLTLLMEREV